MIKKYGDAMAVIESSGKSISYEKLEELLKSVGAKLTRRTLVFSFCENSIGSLVGYLAFLYHKAVQFCWTSIWNVDLERN